MAGLIGGLIGGMGGAAQATDQVATQQIDLNNKQQLAEFTSGLEADRNAQAQRLAQTISQQNTMYNLSPDVTQAQATQASTLETAKLANQAKPENLAAAQKIESTKPIQVGPMHTLGHVDNEGKFVPDFTNQNSPYFARTAGQKEKFTAQEIDQGLTSVTGFVEKAYGTVDPVSNKATTPPALTNIAATEYMNEVNGGATPAQARTLAQQRVTNAYESANAVLNDPRYADQVKAAGGGLSGALRVATALKTGVPAAPKAQGGPTAPAAPTAPRGLVSSAMAVQPIVGGPRDPDDYRDPDPDVPRTQADEDAQAPKLTDDNAAKAARDKFTAAERERLARRGSSATGL